MSKKTALQKVTKENKKPVSLKTFKKYLKNTKNV